MNILDFVKGLAASVQQGGKIGRNDLGVLKVAFMVAALDGEVSDAEYEAFSLMAKECPGYTEAGAAKALDEAMRSAGYLLLLSKRVDESVLVKAFLAEADAAMPDGFIDSSVEDVRRAVTTWVAMAMSDGDYSPRERACVEALRQRFAERKVVRDNENLIRASTPLQMSEGIGPSPVVAEIVSQDFVGKVEKLVAQLGDTSSAKGALFDLLTRARS